MSRFIPRRGARLVAVASMTGVLMSPGAALADPGPRAAAQPTLGAVATDPVTDPSDGHRDDEQDPRDANGHRDRAAR